MNQSNTILESNYFDHLSIQNNSEITSELLKSKFLDWEVIVAFEKRISSILSLNDEVTELLEEIWFNYEDDIEVLSSVHNGVIITNYRLREEWVEKISNLSLYLSFRNFITENNNRPINTKSIIHAITKWNTLISRISSEYISLEDFNISFNQDQPNNLLTQVATIKESLNKLSLQNSWELTQLNKPLNTLEGSILKFEELFIKKNNRKTHQNNFLDRLNYRDFLLYINSLDSTPTDWITNIYTEYLHIARIQNQWMNISFHKIIQEDNLNSEKPHNKTPDVKWDHKNKIVGKKQALVAAILSGIIWTWITLGLQEKERDVIQEMKVEPQVASQIKPHSSEDSKEKILKVQADFILRDALAKSNTTKEFIDNIRDVIWSMYGAAFWYTNLHGEIIDNQLRITAWDDALLYKYQHNITIPTAEINRLHLNEAVNGFLRMSERHLSFKQFQIPNQLDLLGIILNLFEKHFQKYAVKITNNKLKFDSGLVANMTGKVSDDWKSAKFNIAIDGIWNSDFEMHTSNIYREYPEWKKIQKILENEVVKGYELKTTKDVSMQEQVLINVKAQLEQIWIAKMSKTLYMWDERKGDDVYYYFKINNEDYLVTLKY